MNIIKAILVGSSTMLWAAPGFFYNDSKGPLHLTGTTPRRTLLHVRIFPEEPGKALIRILPQGDKFNVEVPAGSRAVIYIPDDAIPAFVNIDIVTAQGQVIAEAMYDDRHIDKHTSFAFLVKVPGGFEIGHPAMDGKDLVDSLQVKSTPGPPGAPSPESKDKPGS